MGGSVISLTAQIEALRIIVTRGTPNNLMKGSFVFRRNEAEMLKERLTAALATLEGKAK